MLAQLRPRLTYANVVATLALFVALSTGGAYAANTVFSTDIVDGEVKTADLANEAVTAPKLKPSVVTTDRIAGGAVTSEKVKDNNLGGRDVLDNTLKGVDIDESTLTNIGGGGPAGGDLAGTYPSPEIRVGAVGAGELGFVDVFSNSISIAPNGGTGNVSVACPPGTKLIAGGAFFGFPSGEVSASRLTGSSTWIAEGQNNGLAFQDLTVQALCIFDD
jgi:hypothetical protein